MRDAQVTIPSGCQEWRGITWMKVRYLALDGGLEEDDVEARASVGRVAGAN